jgi:broad specificity phosphatase PhoE
MNEPSSVLVFCVRHGETSWNEAGLLQGQTDIPLNDRGRQQARQAGVFLAQRHQLDGFAGYVSSDLSRAFETASLIMAALPAGGSPQTDKRLRETHMGRWQGKTWEDVTTDPDDRIASDKWRRDPDYPVPGEGGESFRVRFSRVAAATHAAALQAAAVATGALADRSASRVTASAESSASLHAASTPPLSSARVLLVSHGGVLDDVARLVKKVGPSRSPIFSQMNVLLSDAGQAVTLRRKHGAGQAVVFRAASPTSTPTATRRVVADPREMAYRSLWPTD